MAFQHDCDQEQGAGWRYPPDDRLGQVGGVGYRVALAELLQILPAHLRKTAAVRRVLLNPAAAIRILPPLFDRPGSVLRLERTLCERDELLAGNGTSPEDLGRQDEVELAQPAATRSRVRSRMGHR
jgi:hypothetical protein